MPNNVSCFLSWENSFENTLKMKFWKHNFLNQKKKQKKKFWKHKTKKKNHIKLLHH